MKFLNKKTLLVSVGVLACVVILAPQPVSAIWGFSEIVGGVFHLIGYALNFIVGLVVMLGGWLVDVTLKLNFAILDKDKNILVEKGWTISRDLANLGFVLLAIVVAIATIIRYNEYSAKRLLLKLIAAAILVNFSLTIAGSLVQFSNVLTKFFIGRSVGDSSVMSEAIAGIINPQKLFTPDISDPPPPDPENQSGAIGTFSTAFLTSIAALVFNVVFLSIAAITMLAFAFMLLLRYIHLSFLLILSPMVCLFFIFPGLSKYWSKWWDDFVKWIFFAPALSFFVYLAFTAAQQLNNPQSGLPAMMSTGFGFGVLTKTFTDGIQMLVLAAILLGGLIVANSMGISGAGAAISAAKGLGAGTKKWAGKAIQRRAQQSARTEGGQRWAGRFGSLGKTLQGFASGSLETKETDSATRKGLKKGLNLISKVTRITGGPSLIGAGGGKFGDLSKGMTELAKKQDIKHQFLAGHAISGVGEGAGLWKKKEEKPKEEKTKKELEEEITTKENLKENMIKGRFGEEKKLEEGATPDEQKTWEDSHKKRMEEILKVTSGIDEEIKRIKNELNKKLENEIRTEFATQDLGQVRGELKNRLDKQSKMEEALKELTKTFEGMANNDPLRAKTESDIKKSRKELEAKNFEIRILASIAKRKDDEQKQLDKAQGVARKGDRSQGYNDDEHYNGEDSAAY